jgi:hypothetical protein
MTDIFALLTDLAADPGNSWSIGSFGAIGEFVRDPDEDAAITREADLFEIVTARGGMSIAPTGQLTPIAWDSLSGDGESWGHALAFCVTHLDEPNRSILPLGVDRDALRPRDRDHSLFDLGVGTGAVRMCLRTGDDALITALENAAGEMLLSRSDLMAEVLRVQPHRVLLSPAGRIEVFQPIPPPDGKSPPGPHTHLLPKLIAKDRPHSANVPIPEGWQSALTLHPRSPWRTSAGEKVAYDPAIDAAFAPLLGTFGLEEDAEIEKAILDTIGRGAPPEFAGWPATRRGRTKARIMLRRLAAAGDDRARPWRIVFDRAPVEIEDGEEA